jgi:hypothetical protein
MLGLTSQLLWRNMPKVQESSHFQPYRFYMRQSHIESDEEVFFKPSSLSARYFLPPFKSTFVYLVA